jgi:mannan endo-1,4-beta-mannosidase
MRSIARLPTLIGLSLLLACSTGQRGPASVSGQREWTAATRAAYELLGSLRGKKFLLGHQNATTEGRGTGEGWGEASPVPSDFRSDIRAVSGDFPAVYGWDLLDLQSPALRAHILAAHERGGINTISWHMPNPVTGAAYNDTTEALAKIQPGEAFHDSFVSLMDRAADFLDTLRDRQGRPIPILFRPFHEHNGNWFWWGISHGSEALYVDTFRMFVDHLVNRRGLKNLIIVYSPDASGGGFAGFDPNWGYPGDEWVDVIGMDEYIDVGRYSGGQITVDALRNKVGALVEMARRRGKIAALAELGLEGITNDQWWTSLFIDALGARPEKGEPALTDQLSYFMLWRNAHESPRHFFAPYPGHPSVPDFLKLKASGKVGLNEDLKKAARPLPVHP